MIGGTCTLDDLVGRCAPGALDELDDRSLASLATSLLRWWPRLDAARLRVLAAVESRQAYRVDGARDAASWLAWKGAERRGRARSEIELAAAVAAMPVVDQAMGNGALSRAKASELARARTADPDQQAELVEAAKTMTVEAVARRVDRWQHEQGSPTTVEPRLAITPRPGGGHLDATLDTEGLEWVTVAIDTAAETIGLGELPWEQRRAHGLVAICRHFLDHAKVPVRRQGRPTVVVTLDADALAGRAGRPARLDSGSYVTGEVARKLACDAGVVRMVTDPASQPLDVGRATRSVSPAQARAVIHRDRHCRYSGCAAPAWACDVHHLDPWWCGGRTDLARLGLLCWHHHHLVHRHETTHELVDQGDGRLALELRRRERPPPTSRAA
jgi:Domain of unknown function (DUF222)